MRLSLDIGPAPSYAASARWCPIALPQRRWLNAAIKHLATLGDIVMVWGRIGRGQGSQARLMGLFGSAAALLLLAASATPAAAQYGGGGATGSLPGNTSGANTPSKAPAVDTTKNNQPLPLNSFETALKLKQSGDCPKAMQLLEPLAKSGHGFEVAQLNLGQCYLKVADAKPEATDATDSRKTGVNWIVRAANAGLAPAQEMLARLTLVGGKFRVEPPEAGKWYLVWKRNPTRSQLGASEFDPAVLRQLQATLTDDDWAEAGRRADAWHITDEPSSGAEP
jgi:hypothetical protein